jgi:hypothetical protein
MLQLQNVNNWEQVHNASYSAAPGSLTGYYVPIPAFELPITLERTTLAVRCYNPDALPKWFLGARLTQLVPTGLIAGQKISGTRLNARINAISLLRFPKISTDYVLRCEIPTWFKELEITIWQYVGTGDEDVEQAIAALSDKIDNLQIEVELGV